MAQLSVLPAETGRPCPAYPPRVAANRPAPEGDVVALPPGTCLRARRMRVGTELAAALPAMTRFARSLARSRADADDLVQEASLRALERAGQWDPSRSFEGWICRVMRNLWISSRRRDAVRLGEGQVPAEDVLVEDHDAWQRLESLAVRAAVLRLPSDLGDVLVAVALEGCSYAEAAQRFGIPAGTVMSRLHRARRALQEISADGAP
ncbi:RNA polymerase sigma factor [Poseidonocella sp. HB161398]|uniref:RNA polymerase sigma factor n=1 Tax=Poseidonocella sp. HB161398 TaxID=2320855 RepID=UPI001107CE5F|nr:RNA polymerase sigma factor [Poseidonocella sp. HB161398]